MAKILVIDDESVIVMVLEEVLQDAGHEVFTAADGLQGLELLKKGLQPELLIIDLLMPGMGGRDFLKAVRADFKLANLQVILLTGSVPNERDFPPGDTYHDVICKPFNIDDVVMKANRLLNIPWIASYHN